MTNLKSVTAFAPASVGNAGCGFDIMGFAIDGAGDNVTVSFAGENSDKIKLSGKYGNLIPAERNKNTAGVAIDAFLNATGNSTVKIYIELEKNLPLGSGLGSSASSAAAAVFAVNELLGKILPVKELIPFAMEGERIACGTAHADNVAPSLLGGFILIRSNEPLDIISIPVPSALFCAVIHPHVELLTSKSRSVVKQEVPLSVAIKQNAHTSAFVAALFKSDFELMNRSFIDLFAEPYRIPLIPGFENVKREALEAGAIGFGISGSGPSVFAFCKGENTAQNIASVMEKEFCKINMECDVFTSSVNAGGAKIMESK
ncbi:MAG: homoserine kinase [Bacteroidia bacterium]